MKSTAIRMILEEMRAALRPWRLVTTVNRGQHMRGDYRFGKVRSKVAYNFWGR